MFKNNLKEVIKIVESQAVLVQGSHVSDEASTLIEKLVFRISAVLRAKESRYILLNAPNNKIHGSHRNSRVQNVNASQNL